MYVQRHIPLLKILIPFIGGILLCSKFPNLFNQVAVFIAVLGLLVIVSHFFLKRHINSKIQFLTSLGLLAIISCLGYLICFQSTSINSPLHFSKHNAGKYSVVKVVSNPIHKSRSIACEVEFLSRRDSVSQMNCNGKAQLYLEKDSASEKLNYGDLIVLQKELDTIPRPMNPHQFDLRKFYASKGIYHSSFIPSHAWLSTHINKGNWLFSLSYNIQDHLKQKFKHYFKDESIRGVAEAIVFGFKDDLNEDWLEAFSKTGTIHVLAVSGLHVGIIYILIAFLLGLSKSKRKYIALKTTGVLIVLFFYCLITGFSPSVSRASLMFGMVILSNLWQRQSNVYNALCFACIVLLISNPENIYHVGFQFSFLAVLGIVLYNDYFTKLLPTTNVVLSKIVVLLTVSISAQIATFPLGLYYFHQFPNLFVISNLIVIPCIGIILYSGLLFVLSSFIFPPIANLIAKVMSVYIEFISDAVLFFQDIPFAFFEDVHISYDQMLYIYLFIISLTYGLLKRKAAVFILTIVFAIFFLVADLSEERDKAKVEVIYFRDGKDLFLGFRENNYILFLAPKEIYTSPESFNYVIQPYLINERLINNYDILPLEITRIKSDLGIIRTLGNGNLWFNNQSYFIADYIQDYIGENLQVNYLVIGNKKSLQYYDVVKRKVDAISIVE